MCKSCPAKVHNTPSLPATPFTSCIKNTLWRLANRLSIFEREWCHHTEAIISSLYHTLYKQWTITHKHSGQTDNLWSIIPLNGLIRFDERILKFSKFRIFSQKKKDTLKPRPTPSMIPCKYQFPSIKCIYHPIKSVQKNDTGPLFLQHFLYRSGHMTTLVCMVF